MLLPTLFVVMLAQLPNGEPASSSIEALGVLPAFKFEGGVDVYYGFNFNHPANHASFTPGMGTIGKRANEFGLNLASFGVSVAPEPVGFRVLIGYGTALEVLHAGETSGVVVGPEIWRFLQGASLMWRPGAVEFEAGVYESHLGLESLQSQLNWMYTRTWMGEFSPDYQTGIKATYTFSPTWSAQLHLINGWQLIGDNNQAPALGAQIAYASERLTFSLNTFAGPELPGDERHWRLFGDLVTSFKFTEKFEMAASVDAGLQQREGTTDAAWYAASLYLRYAVSRVVAVVARGEVCADPDGAMTGVGQVLSAGTVTLEVRPVKTLAFKLEGRHDRSTRRVFATRATEPDGTPSLVPTQSLVIGSAVAYF
jgi:hypothetical protein